MGEELSHGLVDPRLQADTLAGAEGQRVLVVENELVMARTIHRVLSRAGYQVVVARSCACARTLVGSFDLGVLDLELDDGSGLTLALRLLDSRRVGRVVFFTAAAYQRILLRASRLGPVVSKREGVSALLAEMRRER